MVWCLINKSVIIKFENMAHWFTRSTAQLPLLDGKFLRRPNHFMVLLNVLESILCVNHQVEELMH